MPHAALQLESRRAGHNEPPTPRLAIERETFREEIVILHGVKDGADDAHQLIVLRVRKFAPDVARRDQNTN